ncbi:MAG TPA: carboxypeptidase regulatory-like domain-containing protein [Candidatus Desulfofervidus auxilii]|uniref:Carboxypeptidase regulatory-like domain-containing protein n=1 Tax=Desulfofervidus auxilii TaxID=1621989 RepID=A0A7C0U393_DESA2|nr:carboxypeptidase regulatory-like domain-containing protein [Candidatus Desulfofervidus auxilii]
MPFRLIEPKIYKFKKHKIKIAGIVKKEGIPTANVLVRLYKRQNGQLISETKTDNNGNFEFIICDNQNNYYFVVAHWQDNSYNALIYDWITGIDI